MKNCEFYASELARQDIDSYKFLAVVKGQPTRCTSISCRDCDFCGRNCPDPSREWWDAEYLSPEEEKAIAEEIRQQAEALKMKRATIEKENKLHDEILNTAKYIINGRREGEYGKAEDSFSKIAQYWTAYTGHEITALDVSVMMILLKIARLDGAGSLDCFIDVCGYAALGAEMWKRLEDDGK